MKTIYKYELQIAGGIQRIDMPKISQILHVGNQGEKLCMWVAVITSQEKVSRNFMVAGTGHELTDDTDTVHIGSAIFAQGALVWHVFEIGDLV